MIMTMMTVTVTLRDRHWQMVTCVLYTMIASHTVHATIKFSYTLPYTTRSLDATVIKIASTSAPRKERHTENERERQRGRKNERIAGLHLYFCSFSFTFPFPLSFPFSFLINMKLLIKTLQQKSFPVEVEPGALVSQLKKMIESTEKIDPIKQMLIHQGQSKGHPFLFPRHAHVCDLLGKILMDDKPVDSYSVKENDFIVLMTTKV